MMTLLFMAMFATALILGMVPVVVFGLMLETVEKRARSTRQVTEDPAAPAAPQPALVAVVRAAA